MKKFVALLLILTLINPNCLVSAKFEFNDLSSSHWAYSYISELVNNGTISGYTDGSFKPSNTVTRAEFAKMMGIGTGTKSYDYMDVPKNHWAYSYIMKTEVPSNSPDYFKPSQPITRLEVVKAIWARNGSPKTSVAPSIITNQGDNKEAVAWVYEKGIIQGNDGINLRLNDTLSRAEAAAIIVRAKDASKTLGFAESADNKILKNVIDSLGILDTEYSENKIITNGEMCRAALRIAANSKTLSYSGYSAKVNFTHEYAKDVAILNEYCLGETSNAMFADAPATTDNTLAAFTYALLRKTSNYYDYNHKNNYYTDIQSVKTNTKNVCLTFAYNNGIRLYANDTINSNKPVTHRELAAMLIELDNLIGTQTAYATGFYNNQGTAPDNSLQYTEKYADGYSVMLAELPDEVYKTGYISAKGQPKDVSEKVKAIYEIFINILKTLKSKVRSQSDVSVNFVFYPTLTVKNNIGYTMRTRLVITRINQNNSSETVNIKDILPCIENVENITLKEGSEVFVDIATNEEITSFDTQCKDLKITQVIKVVK